MEVAGLYSALHIARLQVNMADPLHLGQARSIKVGYKSTVLYQDLVGKTLGGEEPLEAWTQKLDHAKAKGLSLGNLQAAASYNNRT